jgi:hypothetical protein
MSRLRRCFVALTAMLLVAGIGVGAAAAAAPSNDTEAGAIEISSLPFTHSMDTSDATTDGPRFCSTPASVFYSFTPETTSRVQVDLIGSEYDTTLGVYTRSDAGEVQPVTCNDDRFGLASGVRFRARAGVTYFLIVGQCCGHRGGGGGVLVLTAGVVTNVDLEYAIQVTGGTTDPATGIATLTGTVTCNERSAVYREATLRQLRQEIFVARAYFYNSAVCTPDSPSQWSVEVDTETGIAFGPGPAVMRTWYESGYDGWRDVVYQDDLPQDDTVVLQ